MAQYLVAIYLPDDFNPSSADKSMEHDIDVLNEEMEAKGCQALRWRAAPGEGREGAASAAR